MAVEEFLRTYQQSLLDKKYVNPLAGNRGMGSPSLGISNPSRGINQTPTMGPQLPAWLQARKSSAIDSYMTNKSERTTDIASDYASKAAGQVPVDKFGIVQNKSTDFNQTFKQQLSTTGNLGKAALATEEAKADWHYQQGLREQNAGYAVNWTPGASSGNKGAQAVSLAMDAHRNGTPYAWGGNSLSGGVDCSGLVQQVYKKLGINVPRTTYEQAKSGRRVSIGDLQPGDLVFYNTGSNDPNGIGNLSHVGIYIGNGQMVDARNSRSGIKTGSINVMGGPAMAVRPW